MERLKERVAIVTGSGQGMGLAIAHACAREGAKIVVADINDQTIATAVEEIRKQEGADVIGVKIDITKRSEVEKGIKQTLAAALSAGTRYRIYHHPSASCMGLQVADYCNWAIYRKWDAQDERSYQLIRPVIVSEFDFCRTVTTLFY